MRIPHEVLVVVRRGDEFLVLHRAPRYESYWHVVAGALEGAETPREAALRELREELELTGAGLVDLECRFAYALADESEAVRFRFDPSVTEVVVDAFVADAAPSWEPSLNDEHDGYRWCTAAEACALLFWPEPRELVLELAPR